MLSVDRRQIYLRFSTVLVIAWLMTGTLLTCQVLPLQWLTAKAGQPESQETEHRENQTGEETIALRGASRLVRCRELQLPLLVTCPQMRQRLPLERLVWSDWRYQLRENPSKPNALRC